MRSRRLVSGRDGEALPEHPPFCRRWRSNPPHHSQILPALTGCAPSKYYGSGPPPKNEYALPQRRLPAVIPSLAKRCALNSSSTSEPRRIKCHADPEFAAKSHRFFTRLHRPARFTQLKCLRALRHPSCAEYSHAKGSAIVSLHICPRSSQRSSSAPRRLEQRL